MFDSIRPKEIISRAACLDDIDVEHSYHKSYYHFVNYFEKCEKITEHELVIGSNFSYGWMPTILNFKSCEFEKCKEVLNKAKGPRRISTEELLTLKSLVNNSIVGTSKLLHFINPFVYAIWDSRVCNFLTGCSYKYKVEKPEMFWSYLDLCEKIVSDKRFDAIHRKFVNRLGYDVTPLRTIEQIMFLNSTLPLVLK